MLIKYDLEVNWIYIAVVTLFAFGVGSWILYYINQTVEMEIAQIRAYEDMDTRPVVHKVSNKTDIKVEDNEMIQSNN